ncbi:MULTISPECIES: hypothetical protein [Trichocoleus]|uniref:Uncharacterized protein n=1 Tax=Trichocoleus desertorum GB2-A4 TaxID=2933944 RepID=A0ABV0JCB5_9CYAN|nr:hypothetical protein [Trichocoleus sp. FACHB-46]MBD1863149.1 hypothetical protein [Trichocoleus sp. FACHB-46]
MAETYITCQELIKTLKITSDELMGIEKLFDSILDDEWELIKGKDYKIVINSNGLREYTQSGAYTIARYLEATQKQSFWQWVKEWFLHTKREIRRSFIRRKILDNCSSLVKRNNQFFISRANVVTIFGTRSDYLTKMADYTQRTQNPLIKGEDYEDFVDDGGLYFSLSGIYKLAQAFEECQTKKNRKEECKEVGEVIKPQIDDIVSQIINREKRIQNVKDHVKKRDGHTCKVTGKKKNYMEKGLKLAAHHLYSQRDYPHLADIESNLITLACEVHDQFHQDFMGGTNKTCTIDNFIDFVQQYYPSKTQIVIDLQQKKLVLGDPQPMDARKPHVLYLTASRVQ